jgi:hypothetical protein
MRYILLMCVALVMTGCEAFDWIPQQPGGMMLNDRTIIFNEVRAKDFSWAADYIVDNKLVDEDGFWMPTAAQIEALEIALAENLSKNERWDTSIDAASYYRQYFGFTVEDTPYIYGALFCQEYDFNWQEALVFVMDGGTCFIDLAYNVDTGEIVSLYIHGEA